MLKTLLITAFSLGFAAFFMAQTTSNPQPYTMLSAASSTNNPTLYPERPSEIVDYDAFVALAQEVQPYRKDRLVNLDRFLELAQQPNTIILDTRSQQFFQLKHIKGAKNLAFSDFTIQNLARVIPTPFTTILIYCNNNFASDPFSFPSKIAPPPPAFGNTETRKPISLALNIPTFINLYGYGYRNIYELQSWVDVRDPRLVFEGSTVTPVENKQ